MDLKRDAIYISVGNNYSDPPTDTSDAVMALDRASGKILWSHQMTANDAYTVDCHAPVQINCLASKGPDFDFAQKKRPDSYRRYWHRAADNEMFKKFFGVKGDIEPFGEFIRLYISRNERWGSPLFILGESYGTTRAAGIAGYLADRGISFNGITLLSTVFTMCARRERKE